ncbi:MAG: GNAT family N-acetyltransferase [Pirellulales bacterium]
MTGSQELELDLLQAEDRQTAARLLNCEYPEGIDVVAATRNGALLGVIAVELQAGWTASVEAPRVMPDVGDESDRIANQLWRAAESYARRRGVSWLQTLVAEETPPIAQRLAELGFERLGDLSYQVCLARRFPAATPATRLAFRPVAESSPEELSRTVAVTYLGSRDFPEMEGRRSIEDLLDGYRAVGDAAERHWWLAWEGDVPVGCVLLAEHRPPATASQSESAFTELIYWGVVPNRRGHGFGDELLAWSLDQSRLLGADKLILAVDVRNLPARRIYERFGLLEWCEKPPGPSHWRRGSEPGLILTSKRLKKRSRPTPDFAKRINSMQLKEIRIVPRSV